jgi:hypothetical protein
VPIIETIVVMTSTASKTSSTIPKTPTGLLHLTESIVRLTATANLKIIVKK